MNIKRAIPLALVALALAGAGCGQASNTKDTGILKNASNTQAMMQNDQGVMVGGAMMIPARDIVDNAVLANNVTTLVAAVKAADLVDTLKGPGPFTVFAPTNDAFNVLPAGTVETLLKPENKAQLTGILTYHVVPAALRTSDLRDGDTLTTVNGAQLNIAIRDGKTYVNDVMIDTADIISKNGVTHVIGKVLMPPAK